VEVFGDAIGIDGIILTKLDGTAKGGFIISLCYELGVPVTYVGTGEQLDDIEDFDPEEFVEGMF
jgi:fused signal recognition particle receptor